MGAQTQTDNFLVLDGVPWRSYRVLGKVLADHNVRMTYLDGRLEIVSPSAEHEAAKEKFAMAVRLLVYALDLPMTGYGSTTFCKRPRRAGKEPDTCFYIRENARRMWGKRRIDLRVDPPPDLAVEVVASRETVTLTTYLRLGVPEVWWSEAGSLTILRLDEAAGRSIARGESGAIPGLRAETAEACVEAPATDETDWRKKLEGPIAVEAARLRAAGGTP